MVFSSPQHSPQHAQISFSTAYENWLGLRQRYIRLRDASDRVSSFPGTMTTSVSITTTLETEIEELECDLEDITYDITQANNITHQDLSAILQVLEADMRGRLLMDESDAAVQLLRIARSVAEAAR